MLLATAFSVILSVSEGSPAAAIFDVQRHRLPNGLEVWIKPRHETQAVEVRAVVKVGHRYERPRDSGLSHLLEHMLFKGTTRQSEAELKWAVERRGGTRNGITSPEATYYYVNIRDAHFEFALDWLEDILFHSRLAEEHLRQARKDVYSEQGGRYPRALERIFLAGFFQPAPVAAAEKSFPHAHVAERALSNLEHVGAESLRQHFQSYYAPNNMAVIVVGNVDAQAALQGVQQRFGKLQPKAVARPAYLPYASPRIVDEVRTRFFPPVGQMTEIYYGLWTRGHADRDRHALRLIARHLDRRVKEEVRYRRALAYRVGCGFVEGLDVGVLYAYAEVPRGAERQTKEIMRRVLDEVRRQRISPADLADAAESYVGSSVRYYENNSRLADLYQDMFLTVPYGAPIPDELALAAQVTAESFLDTARKRLAPAQMMFVVARPPLSYAGAAIVAIVVVLGIGALVFLRVRRRR